ncbi:Retinoid-inducible serine carboxypeptidase [Galemys pyrenaicus]|uniref:Carboxypeptidase n=1 Tax=Galemys pyrenaicus TaxID=202257 RepID=A0A8J6ACQ0_GALPY|nr:Retinoid-inducible serine carboxypeptidase [Galemys pyrenaicus]
MLHGVFVMELAPRNPLGPPLLLLLQLLLLLGLSSGAVINQPTVEGKEVWGYVTVRKDAHMFWWLYYATNSCKNFSELPLVMWLQLQSASLLFVDNPVGTGYSCVNKSDAYAKNLTTVASDMMVLLKTFFDCHKEFQRIPFYIFSESYGGKMAAGISLELHKVKEDGFMGGMVALGPHGKDVSWLLFQAIQQGTIQCNFAGVALGDSWISPVDSVLSWGPYLYSMSLLDDQGLAEVSQIAEQVLDAVNKGLYKEATELWGKAEFLIEENADGVSFYNILKKDTPMSAMKSSLEFTQSHLAQASQVFMNMEGDFMKAVISIVDELLDAGVNVTVYNGQLDLIVDTMGQEAWVRKLKWAELPKFNQLKWKALYSDPESSQTSAFVKSHKNLAFYWILKAGHMVRASARLNVPSDQGDMALKMMRLVTHQE